MIDNAVGELAALIAGALAAGTADRAALLDACLHVIHGGERAKERLGHLVASATIAALQTPTPKGKPGDPIATAEAAFAPPGTPR